MDDGVPIRFNRVERDRSVIVIEVAELNTAVESTLGDTPDHLHAGSPAPRLASGRSSFKVSKQVRRHSTSCVAGAAGPGGRAGVAVEVNDTSAAMRFPVAIDAAFAGMWLPFNGLSC
jgi:hypothetical protein